MLLADCHVQGCMQVFLWNGTSNSFFKIIIVCLMEEFHDMSLCFSSLFTNCSSLFKHICHLYEI